MPRATKKSIKLHRNARFGDISAESDELLEESFFETADYQTLVNSNDSRSLIIGRTGAGKSAIIRRVESELKDRSIRVEPRHLSLHYITDTQVARLAESCGVNIEPLYAELWKHVIVTEVIKFRYGNKPSSNSPIWSGMLQSIRRDDAKKPALEYLEKYGDDFWLRTDEAVRQKIEETELRVNSEMGARLDVSGSSVSGKSGSTEGLRSEIHSEEKERFKKIVGEHQLASLDMVLELLAEELSDSGGDVFVVIDNLDEDWIDRSIYRQLVMALIRTVKDLSRLSGIKVIVAVRTNILRHLDFHSPGTGQREKYQALAIELQWSAEELTDLLDLRAAALIQNAGGPANQKLESMLPSAKRDGSSAIEFVISHTLMRPRDAITLLNCALEAGNSESGITWDGLTQGVRKYSNSRLEAVVSEWNLVYPGMGWLLERFSGQPERLDRPNLEAVLSEAALDSELLDLGAPLDLFQQFQASLSVDDAWSGSFMHVVRVLFEVGFLGLNLDESAPGYVYSYKEPDYANGLRVIPEAGTFRIHRAFHSSLGIVQSSQRSQKAPSG